VIAVVPGVREAAVVAKKHPMLDEVPVVFIIPLAGVDGVPDDLHDSVMAACRGQLGPIPDSVTAGLRHAARVAETEATSVSGGGAPVKPTPGAARTHP